MPVDFEAMLAKKREKSRLKIEDGQISIKDQSEDLESLMDQCGKPSDLEKIWHRAVETYTAPITGKDLIRLKHFATRCRGYQRAAYVVVWAARNWAAITSQPKNPSIKFLLARAEQIVDAAYGESDQRFEQAKKPTPRKKVVKPKGF